jgi:tetratricopeptide (TPR) repeat protein
MQDGDVLNASCEIHECRNLVAQNWDEEVDILLALAHAFSERWSLAHKHLDAAKRKCGATVSPSHLVNRAYVFQLQDKMEQAENHLDQCLSIAPCFPMALLRMGYLMLCRNQFEHAIQYLQKCIQQPSGTLMFGASHYGAAQLYLCISHHLLHGDSNQSSQHFATGIQHRKDLGDLRQKEKLKLLSPRDLLPPQREYKPRGSLDLNYEQARVLLLYAHRKEDLDYESDSDSENHNNHMIPIDDEDIGTFLLTSSVQNVVGDNSGHPKVSGTLLSESASTNASAESTVFTSLPSREISNPELYSTCTGSVGMTNAASSGIPSLAELEARMPHTQQVHLADLEMGQCLASGAFGTVYCGKHYCNDREVDVVVKRLHVKDGTYDEHTAQELQAEIAILSLLSHPRLVRFVGACLKAPDIACVTEYARGGNLHNAIHVLQHHFTREVRFRLSIDLLEGIHYMHSRSPSVAHFDIKTLNLVLDAARQNLQICDFGLARVISGDTSQDGRLRRGGSPRYMAPECLEGSATPLTERADIWSCGCVLLELFGEILPYVECGNAQQIMKMMLVHQQGPTIAASIEDGVKDIIANMLSFNALERRSADAALQRIHSLARFDSRADNNNTDVQPPQQSHQSRFLWIP